MAETAIEWATHVWNPVTGCDRVSPGCAHCYALTFLAHLVDPGTGRTIFEQLADTGTVDLGRPIAGLLEAPHG